MSKFPICNSTLKWFISYFENRKQCVRVGASISDTFDVPSSVGQGSVLGPMLFLIFFDDSDDGIVDSLVWNFADDKRIAQVIRKPNDTALLQKSIDHFLSWCDKNGLSVNAMKCKIMTYSLKTITLHTDYYIKGELVERTNTIRDLGVMMDAELNFSLHIEFITIKAYAMLAFVKRQCYRTLSIEAAKMLFFAFVRSNLEFANQVWCPYQNKYIELIESIQKKFVKFICPNNSANNPNNPHELRPYSVRCDEQHLQILSRRRINACIFLIHDIISGKLSSPQLRQLLSFSKIQYFVRSPEFIRLNTCRLEKTNNSPFRTACRLYNLCALHVDVTLDSTSFKRKVMLMADGIFANFFARLTQ